MNLISQEELKEFFREQRGVCYLEGRESLKDSINSERFKGAFTSVNLLLFELREYQSVLINNGPIAAESYYQEILRRVSTYFPKDSSVVRIASERFALIILNESLTLAQVSSLILPSFNYPIVISERLYSSEVSIGSATASRVNFDIETLIGYAEIATIQASQYPKSKLVSIQNDVFDEQIKSLVESNNLSSVVKTSLTEKKFQVYFQPIISLSNDSVVGFESLARLSLNDQIVSPGEFIPILKSLGLNAYLDILMLEKTLQSIPVIMRQSPGRHFMFSLNLSSQLLANQSMLENYMSLLDTLDENLNCSLQLEIIEEAFELEKDCFDQFASFCSKKNIKLAMDDFGMGSSSLMRLFSLPISSIKLDKFFADEILLKSSPYILSLLNSIIHHFQKADFSITAEGVETQQQASWLAKAGIDYVQGYLYSKPVPLTELLAFLEKHQKTTTEGIALKNKASKRERLKSRLQAVLDIIL